MITHGAKADAAERVNECSKPSTKTVARRHDRHHRRATAAAYGELRRPRATGGRAPRRGAVRAAAEPDRRRPPWHRRRRLSARLFLCERLEGELLAANTRLEHEAPLTGGEDRHAVLVFRVRRRALRSRDRTCLSRERECSLLEVGKRRRRLEEDDFRVGLTTELSPDGDLGERRLTYGLPLLEDDARAGRTANPNRPFGNLREDGIPDRVVEEAGEARICLLEDRDALSGLLHIFAYVHGLGGDPGEETENQQDSYAQRFRYHIILLLRRMLTTQRTVDALTHTSRDSLIASHRFLVARPAQCA